MLTVETEAATTTEEIWAKLKDRSAENNRGGVWHNKAPPLVT